MVIEIAVDIPKPLKELLLGRIEEFLASQKIPFYIEPTDGRFNSLEDVECQCEGK